MRLAVPLAFLLSCQVSWAATQLRLQNVSAPPGATVEVPLVLSGDAVTFISGWVEVTCAAVQPSTAPPLPPLGAAMGPLLPGSKLVVNSTLQGCARLAFASDRPGGGTGRLLSILVSVPGAAPIGALYRLHLRGARLESLDGKGGAIDLASDLGGEVRVASPVPEGARLLVPDLSAKPGALVEVQVSSNAVLPEIQSADILLTFTEATPATAPPLEPRMDLIRPGGLLPSPQMAARRVSRGAIRAAVASSGVGGGEGVLLVVPFQVPEGAFPGTAYTLGLQANVGLADAEWGIHTTGGTLTVTDTGDRWGWKLHLLPEPLTLSPTAGKAAGYVPVTKPARWTGRLRGPLLATLLEYRFYLRGLPPKSLAQARLLWSPAGEGTGAVEIGKWSFGSSAAGGIEAAPVAGTAIIGDLLKARAGDSLTLEIAGPPAVGGTPTEVLVGGLNSGEGDSYIRLASGPPVALEVRPSALWLKPGEGVALQAVVSVDGLIIPDAEVDWTLKPTDPLASLSEKGLFLSEKEGEYQAIATYQGLLAVSRLTVSEEGPPSEPPDQPVRGDVNGDGKVSILDAITALRIAAGLLTPTAQQTLAGDLNGNGRLSVLDVVLLLRVVAGLDPLP